MCITIADGRDARDTSPPLGEHCHAAFVPLRKGLEAEDALSYTEPPGWMQPIRQSFGAVLLEDGRVAEAEAVYRADLARHADNLWSLHVLPNVCASPVVTPRPGP